MNPPQPLHLPPVDVRYLDVTPNLISGNLPMYVLERPRLHDEPKAWAGTTEVARVGRFWVPQLAVFEPDPQWCLTQAGDAVLIPVHAYRTTARALSAIFGLGQQIALAAMQSFLSNGQSQGERIVGVVQVLGHDCTDLSQQGVDAFRCYVGLAFQVAEK